MKPGRWTKSHNKIEKKNSGNMSFVSRRSDIVKSRLLECLGHLEHLDGTRGLKEITREAQFRKRKM